ncbi:MAG: hypothetical protein ACJ8AW_53380, partial [Rhodopila sp.]
MTRITARAIADWSDPSQPTVMTADEATYALHALGPRVRFIKTLPIGASMLDAGAGNGSSILFRTWPAPERPDLAMFAWSGEPGEFFDRFDGHEIGYWPQRPPGFGGRTFDAVLCANFIEHIDDPLVFILAPSPARPVPAGDTRRGTAWLFRKRESAAEFGAWMR